MAIRKSGSDRQVRNVTLLGLVFAAAGFVVIGIGWNGMASRACPDCQLPFLLSGGATGIGLIILGSALLLVGRFRAERLKSDARMEELIRATGRVGSAIASANGPQNGLVVAGRSTYHRPECRLVQGKELDKVTVQAAAEAGLSACRVCSPETPDESDESKEAAGVGAAAAEGSEPEKEQKRPGRKRPGRKGSSTDDSTNDST